MLQNLVEIEVDQLLNAAHEMMDTGYRFVTLTCVTVGENMVDITYHFDKDYEMKNYRIKVDRDTAVPSISGIYFSALLAENEISELFGVEVKDMIVDYKGHMLLTDESLESPQFGGSQIVIEKREAK